MAILFSDLNQKEPKIKPVLREIECIYQSLNNLFSTDEGEMGFDLIEYGFNFEDNCFEMNTEEKVFSILVFAISKIRRFEPRVIPNFQKSIIIRNPENIDENEYILFLYVLLKNFGNIEAEFVGKFKV